MKFTNFCNTIIVWSFYLLFFLIPIVFTSDTSELFEFNKMWLTFALASIIAGTWVTKMILRKKFQIQRTPLDIPILLFLLSQIISSVKSLDPYISWWGYYSRFNGGLLSLITYIFLYYALVSNLTKKNVMNLFSVSLFSGLFVSLWGLPSHFGYDPTCFVFRGSLDVSCWTTAFQPKARIFSTLGQPDWLAAYLLILLPIALVFCINAIKNKKLFTAIFYFLLMMLFYVDFLYTRSKGNFIAFVIPFLFFIPIYFIITHDSLKKAKYFWIMLSSVVIITFFVGTPFPQFNDFTFANLVTRLSTQTSAPSSKKPSSKTTKQPNAITGEFGGTDSGKIRLFVWKGAVEAWKHNFLFGTGVETFAFAYYLYRPAGHNLTSEWDYLYNKAHNEYLNYLATTGLFGILTYLAIIGSFLFSVTQILRKRTRVVFDKKQKSQEILFISTSVLTLGLTIAYLTILISNFFGFSVVIVNIYFFLIPGFTFILIDQLKTEQLLTLPKNEHTGSDLKTTHAGQWLALIVVWLMTFYWLAVLYNYWNADKSYGLGFNLDRVNQYQSAYAPLHQAVAARPDEPTFKDELSANDAILAVAFASQKNTTNATKLAQEAIQTSDEITTNHPNNVTFWKTRVRVMYTLSELDPQYLLLALKAIQKAHQLAPTDAKISYNLGLIYSQNNQTNNAITTLKETVAMKPDYRDAYFALGVLLHQQAIDKNNKVINPKEENEAVATLHFITNTLVPHEKQSTDLLKSWGEGD